MSIAHSIMLLVTLLFVLTTRGITLDFNTTSRVGVRTDLPSPISSPNLKRPSSMLFQPRDHRDADRLQTPVRELRSLEGNMREYQTSGEAVQSAPATPAGSSRTWNFSPSKSHLHANSEREDARIEQDFHAQDALLLEDTFSVSEMDNNSYPTPTSSLEE